MTFRPNHRRCATAFVVTTLAVGALVAPVLAQGPVARPAVGNAGVPRLPDGRPDLQGVWSFATATPMERPAKLGDKATFTDQEIQEFERDIKERFNQDRRDGGRAADVARAYNDFWWDFGRSVQGNRRTSLIIDPPDGRMPPMTAEAKARAGSRMMLMMRPAHGPEDRGVGERCMLGFNSGPPMLPSAYNNHVQIFQTPGHVALLNEMVHNARIIPVNGPPHTSIRQWVGDSRGRWEGDTFVVETKNFIGETAFNGSNPNLQLIERFTRTSKDVLTYEFTVNDPMTWTKPWTVSIPMTKIDGLIYEYACHEGNYGMTNLLTGARMDDAVKEKAAVNPQ
jgi:hypothetical protein